MNPSTDPLKPGRATVGEPPSPATLFGFDKLRRVEKGTALFRAGDPPQGVYFLQSGQVALCVDAVERVRTTHTGEPGDLLGVMAVISSRPHLTTAIATTDCEVGFIGADEFRRLIDESPVVWFSVLRQLSQDVNASYETYKELGTGARA
jgi:CRP-like cAMP-binding protein